MKTVAEIREQVFCAEVNLENLSKQVPGLRNHPFYKIVKYQLACAQVEETDEPTVEEAQKSRLSS